ncbi:hypothetical protein J0H58_29820 [bacterium]|nr:hypothetical protein [bacterium]
MTNASISHAIVGRNDANGLVKISTYQCPSCPLTEHAFGVPNNTNGDSDKIPGNASGSPAAIPHYYGVSGPRGTNPTTGTAYPVGTATHEGVPAATSGMLQRDGTGRFSPTAVIIRRAVWPRVSCSGIRGRGADGDAATPTTPVPARPAGRRPRSV